MNYIIDESEPFEGFVLDRMGDDGILIGSGLTLEQYKKYSEVVTIK